MARHESGHVLFTDDYAVSGQLHAWLTNALEDQRLVVEVDEDGRGTRYRTLAGVIAGVDVVGVPDVVAHNPNYASSICAGIGLRRCQRL
jgi:hypothetical protein